MLSGPMAHAVMAGALPDSPSARVDPNTTTSSWTGVGSVIVSGSAYSGVLVAPRFVLTASHVVGSASASSVQFVLNIGGDQTHVLQAQSIARYPTASFPYDDLALIELTTPAPVGAAIYPLARTSVSTGSRLTIVGYGASGNGDTGVSVGGSRTVKRVGANRLDQIQTALDASGRTSLFYLYDFDGPTGSGSMGGPTLGNAVETLVAGSDSGSPAFVTDGSVTRLVGINTLVASASPGGPIDYRFGSVGGGILLTDPRFLEWVDATTNYTTVDIPTLPQWALIFSMGALTAIAVRRRVA